MQSAGVSSTGSVVLHDCRPRLTRTRTACSCCCLLLLLLLPGQPVLQLADSSSVSCDVLVGADGANSRLARQLGLPQANYAGYVAYRYDCWCGITQQEPSTAHSTLAN